VNDAEEEKEKKRVGRHKEYREFTSICTHTRAYRVRKKSLVFYVDVRSRLAEGNGTFIDTTCLNRS